MLVVRVVDAAILWATLAEPGSGRNSFTMADESR